MKRVYIFFLLVVLMLSLATPALAQGGEQNPDHVLFGRNLSLEEGDVVEGDVVIFGGNLETADGSLVKGSTVVFGGNQDLGGQVLGDVVTIGGNIDLASSGQINGDAVAVGGWIEADEGAEIKGQATETNNFDFSALWNGSTGFHGFEFSDHSPRAEVEVTPSIGFGFLDWIFQVVKAFMLAVVLAVVGLLVVLFLPDHTRVVGETISESGPASFGVGLLTMIVGIAVMLLLFITCLLIPVGLVLGVGLVLAGLYGWIVSGYLVGQRLFPVFQKNAGETSPALAALLGVFVLTIVISGLGAMGKIPCLGFFFWLLSALAWLVAISVGLGAVVLSRFGTRRYTGGAAAAPPPPVPPTPVLPASPPTGSDVGPDAGENLAGEQDVVDDQSKLSEDLGNGNGEGEEAAEEENQTQGDPGSDDSESQAEEKTTD